MKPLPEQLYMKHAAKCAAKIIGETSLSLKKRINKHCKLLKTDSNLNALVNYRNSNNYMLIKKKYKTNLNANV